MKKTLQNNAGFTLIETVVYIGLFAILLAGVFVSAFNIIESGGKNQTRLVMKEEGYFILNKINWAISKAGDANIINSADLQTGDFEFKFDNDKKIITLSENGNEVIQLNNDAVMVTKADFSFIYVEDQGKGIKYSLNLESKTPNGMAITSYFESITYLHK